jgi:prepilin-type N-terminal cleavage/methylation domain-containing protein
MTISAAKTSKKPSAGFTLIELVMVLGISAMVLGGAVTVMVFSTDERDLRNASGEIQLLAKRARTISILHQTPYALEFRPGKVRLLPFSEAGADERKTALGRSIGGDKVERVEPGGRTPVREEVTISGDIAVFIRRWNSDALLPMSERVTHVWRFDPDGLCEPVSVRLVLDESWAEDSFHPLTAGVQDSQLEVR